MKRTVPIWIPIALGLIILMGSGFGTSFYRDLKKELNAQKDELKKVEADAQIKIDSVINIYETQIDYADALRDENEGLRNSNTWFKNELRKRSQAAVNTIDPDFNRNANRLSDSSDRFYKENGTPGQESNDSPW